MGVIIIKEFKEIKLDITTFDNKDIRGFVEIISNSFSKNDLQLFIEGNELIYHLYQLDVNKFHDVIYSTDYSVELKEQIFEIVNKIGSYGVKGSKRHFVGYNNERNVVNRKAKEQNRQKHYYANDNTFSKNNNDIPD